MARDSDSTDLYLNIQRDKVFEKLVEEATLQFLRRSDPKVSQENKLRYVTHIYAKNLDKIYDLQNEMLSTKVN